MSHILTKGKRQYLIQCVAHAAEMQRVDDSVARYIVLMSYPKVTIQEARKRVAYQKTKRREVRDMPTGNPKLNRRLMDGGLRRGEFYAYTGR
ncbi:hypothetical protein D3C87_1305880 [compost metagenome]